MKTRFAPHAAALAIAAVLAAVPCASQAQLNYTSSDIAAKAEIGESAGSSSWNDYGYDYHEDPTLASNSISATSSFAGPDTQGLGETFSGTASGNLTTVLGASGVTDTFDAGATVALLTGYNSYTGPASQGGISHQVTMTAGTSGLYNFSATGTIGTLFGDGAFSFTGYLQDKTAQWLHPFNVAYASTTFNPYTESDTIAAGDDLVLSWYAVGYGYAPLPNASSAEAFTGSVSLNGPSATPEPSSLIALSIAGLGFLKRRSKR